MRRWFSAAFGTLFLGAALALSLPGVKAVQADPLDRYLGPAGTSAQPPAASAASGEGAMCQARSGGPMQAASIHQLAEQLRAQAAADSPDGEPRVVNLNNRGYNYASSGTRVDPSRIQREMRLRR